MRTEVMQQSKALLEVYLGLGVDPGTVDASDITLAFGTPDLFFPVLTWDHVGIAEIMVGPGSDVGELPQGVLDIYCLVSAVPQIPMFKSKVQLSVSKI